MTYLEHFALREPPFRITPRAEIFFAGGNRAATLEALTYAVTHDESMVKVSGEVGSGKTMLCRALAGRLPAGFAAVHLTSPALSRDELLLAIADELGLSLANGRTGRLMRALQERLREMQAGGQRSVLLLDEAHAMPDEALEQLRLLSNLEADRHKLLRIVLFGQPELDLRLMQSEMRQIRERITHNFALDPLQRDEVAAYLAFRMRAAGHPGPSPFTATAVQAIARNSAGLVRRIDILADKALQAACAAGCRQVDRREARAAIRDARFRPIAGTGTQKPAWIGLAAGALLAGLGALHFAGPPKAGQVAHAAPTPERPPPQRAAASLVPPPAAVAAMAAHVPDHRPAAAVPPRHDPTDAAEARPVSAQDPRIGPLTAALLTASAAWLDEAPDQRHFIQLLQTEAGNAGALESFLATHATRLDRHPLRAYRSSLSGRDRIGIIYGDFATAEQAATALARLPDDLRATGPYIRTAGKLR